ncbi:hypothetical protein HYT26_00750 [Candidatus Pacearchaeota archaeon]|nr:hypothetical protein [Candidatus Pacearchaeota archaeon]
MRSPIYPGYLRITSLGMERIVIVKLEDFKKLLRRISREGLISEFAPDKETANSWKKTLREKFEVIDKIEERHSVK